MANCPRCKTSDATHICESCGKVACETCMQFKRVGTSELRICPECGYHLNVLDTSSSKTEGHAKEPLGTWIKNLFKKLQPAQKTATESPARLLAAKARGLAISANYKQALYFYNQAYEIAPNDPRILEERFELLTRMGLKDEAETASMELVALRIRLGDYHFAASIYTRLIATNPKIDPGLDVLWALGQWFENVGKFSEAATLYQKLAAIHPTSQQAPQALMKSAEIHVKYLPNRIQAEKLYHYITVAYSGTEYAQQAQKQIESLKSKPAPNS